MKKTINKLSFTLIEILVTISIIAILAAGAAISYSSLTKGSRDARRKSDLENIRAAFEMYRSANNNYPNNVGTYINGNCSTLSTVPTFTSYMPIIPTDPKTGYIYYCTTSASDYTVEAFLESGSICTGSHSCTGATSCNYCVGPYGQKP